MSENDESDEDLTQINEIASQVEKELLPAKSKKKYDLTYAQFCDWMKEKKVKTINQNVILSYFKHLATTKNYAPTTMWSKWSMLRTEILLDRDTDIGDFPKVKALLKGRSKGHKPKQAEVFDPEEVRAFLLNAPDDVHLANKV